MGMRDRCGSSAGAPPKHKLIMLARLFIVFFRISSRRKQRILVWRAAARTTNGIDPV
jgi:hypothetical protein